MKDKRRIYLSIRLKRQNAKLKNNTVNKIFMFDKNKSYF